MSKSGLEDFSCAADVKKTRPAASTRRGSRKKQGVRLMIPPKELVRIGAQPRMERVYPQRQDEARIGWPPISSSGADARWILECAASVVSVCGAGKIRSPSGCNVRRFMKHWLLAAAENRVPLHERLDK